MRVLLLLATACQCASPEPLGLEPVALPARMIHVVSGPVSGPPEAPPATEVFRETFEPGAPPTWETNSLQPGAKATGTVTAVDGHLELKAGEGPLGAMPGAYFPVDVRPGDVLRVSVEQRAVGLDPRGFPAEGVGMAVVERGEEPREHDIVPREYGTSEWRTVELDVPISAGTTSADVVLLAGPVLVAGGGWFDDLVVERRSPESVADDAFDPVGGAAPGAVWVKAGGELRPSLAGRAPSSWALAVPGDAAELTFGVARSDASASSARLCWTVAVAAGGVLSEGCLEPNAPDAWTDVAVALPAQPGPRELHFSLSGSGGIAVGAFGDPVVQPAAPDTEAPDIVLVTVAGLRADDPVPALDALAEVGTRWTAATAASTWDLPGLSSILTGWWPHRHRAGAPHRDLRRPRAWKQSVRIADRDRYVPLADEARTLAEHLGGSGYTSFAVAGGRTVWPWRGVLRGFGQVEIVDRTPEDGDDPVGDAVTAWFEALGPRETRPPTFVLAEVQDLVLPWRLDPANGPAPTDLPGDATEGGTKLTNLTRYARKYPDSTRRLHADERGRAAARIQAVIDAAPPDAAVVVVGEHGTALGEGEMWGQGLAALPAVLDVPLVVRGPGVEAGRTVDAPVSTAAVAPTVLQLAGLPVPGDLDAGTLLGASSRSVFSEGVIGGAAELAVRAAGGRARFALPQGTDGPPDERLGMRGLPIDLPKDPRIEVDAPDADAPDALALLASLGDRIRRWEPGLHVSCDPGPAGALTVSLGGAATRVQALAGGSAHDVSLVGSRDRIEVALVADTPLWMLARFREVRSVPRFAVDGVDVPAAPLPALPSEAVPVGERCRAWLVPPPE